MSEVFKRCKGIGPVPAEWMLVAECPGYYEGLKGIPLVGKTGDEVNRYLDGVNLPTRSEERRVGKECRL